MSELEALKHDLWQLVEVDAKFRATRAALSDTANMLAELDKRKDKLTVRCIEQMEGKAVVCGGHVFFQHGNHVEWCPVLQEKSE